MSAPDQPIKPDFGFEEPSSFEIWVCVGSDQMGQMLIQILCSS